jgi:hypothetical protein
MSSKYPGGVISKTAPVPSGPYADSTAPGIWTLEQQAAYAKLGQWPTAGNVNPSAFIENLFSTYLYTGNGSTQTINNGIDLSTNGGLVWLKTRSVSQYHYLFDTIRGPLYALSTNATDNSYSIGNTLTSFGSTGFSLGLNSATNGNGDTFASWTFRKQPKFFDIVTWSGTGSVQNIAHNLGSVPGCIIVKRTDTATNWVVYHRSLNTTAGGLIALNLTNGELTDVNAFNSTVPTSTVFTVGSASSTNGSGGTFVAYVFAHDAGGFGTSGSDNVISCGSYTGTASTDVTVNLGYEPQWVMIKRTDSSGSPAWWIGDTMRGLNMQGINRLEAWTSNAESAAYNGINPTATGFVLPTGTVLNDAATSNYIYIAIRRGPMAVPTLGTSVYAPVAYTGDATNNRAITTGFVSDTVWWKSRSNATNWRSATLLIGANTTSSQNLTAAEEYVAGYYIKSYQNTGFTYDATDSSYNQSGYTYVADAFKRAPGFHDVVCYTGTGSNRTVTHNLGVVPELMIVKSRGTNDWAVYNSTSGATQAMYLNSTTAAFTLSTFWNDTAPTSTVFTVGTRSQTNEGGINFVAYLFATCAGVSKVGSYTGTGALITVNCGFTSGARFVLIRRTDATGNWYNYDSARGITSGSDPSLWVNSASAETTGTNYVDTDTTGFKVTAAAPAQLNDPGGTYIFLAIA